MPMIIKDGEKVFNMLNTQKTLDVLKNMLEESVKIESKLKKTNDDFVKKVREERTAFVDKILKHNLIDEFNQKVRKNMYGFFKKPKKIPVRYDPIAKIFLYGDIGDHEFSDLVYEKIKEKWITPEVEISTLTTIKEKLESLIRSVSCLHEETFCINFIENFDFSFYYERKKVNIWDYQIEE